NYGVSRGSSPNPRSNYERKIAGFVTYHCKRFTLNDANKKLHQLLTTGTTQLGLSLSENQIEKLLAYIQEFDKWNKAYNLSAIRNIEQMIPRHLLDSLSVVPYVKNTPAENIIDVGTGGGLPG